MIITIYSNKLCECGLSFPSKYTGHRDHSHPGWIEWDGWRFYHILQHGTQFKIYELFISGMCHLIFLDHG